MWFCRLTSKKLGRCVCLASSFTFVFTTTQLHPFLQPQQTVKRSDDTHEFCKHLDSSWILVSDISLKIRRPVAGLDLVRPLFAWRWESLTLLSRCFLLYPILLQYLHSFKKLCETSLSCSSTLASFRYILTDWRPFKGARLNSPFSVSFLLITLECGLFIGRCLKRKEKRALEFGTSINGWVCFLAILCTKTMTNTFFSNWPSLLYCNSSLFEVSLLHTLDGVYSLHARSHFTEARKTWTILLLRNGSRFLLRFSSLRRLTKVCRWYNWILGVAPSRDQLYILQYHRLQLYHFVNLNNIIFFCVPFFGRRYV